MTAERRVMIVGAGIGGLTAAIALERAGWEVVLFERMEGLLDVGAGFIINVNAVTAMRDIGLDKEIENGGVAISSFAHRTTDGKLLANWDVGAISRKLGAPIVGIARPELQRPLVDALATTELRFGHECTGVEQDESGVTAHFANGAQERAGALVAADGADSRIRACFDQTPRRYAGYTTWLATSELDPGYAPATHTVWYGRSAIVGAHPVAGGKTKWYAAQTTPPGAPDFDLVGLFGDWTEPVPAIVDQTRPPQRFDVYDLPRREQWGSGRVTLLGDAAHPMVPALGQGACQAMEDGIVLARLLTPGADPAKALRAYERDRIERTAKIVKLSRIRGALMQGDNPAIRIARYCSLRVIPQSRLLKGFEKLGTFPATG